MNSFTLKTAISLIAMIALLYMALTTKDAINSALLPSAAIVVGGFLIITHKTTNHKNYE